MSEEGKNPGTGQQIDYTTYPEGFEAALKLLDFLPEDEAARRRFMLGLMDNLARR